MAESKDHVESTQLESSPDATGRAELVGELSAAAQTSDHEEGVFQAIRNHRRAFFWCIYAIYVLIISSFDNQAGGIVVGVPQFRKDFGSPFAGDYVLPAKWQSAYSGGPVAS